MLKRAREVINIEARAVKGLLKNLDGNFSAAVDVLARCAGRVVVCGMGKTGIIGRKIAATFSSTGTPSVFVHSAEAVHGDLGQVTPKDILIVLSQSGETEETVRLLPLIKKIGARTIAMTGNPKSSLAQYSDIVLNTGVAREGCPLGLAPMASTTATLALGDALAACLIDRRGFKKEDFAFNHPGGSLGRRLLLKVEDIMRTGPALVKVKAQAKVKDVLLAITRARSGCACVVDGQDRLAGIFTDGDLRRHLEAGADILTAPVGDVMTRKAATVTKDKLAAQAFDILKTKNIDELPVVDKANKVVGLVDVQDLLKAGLV
ncbi:MAG: KpsF/GutQ family sugar-phosphate isomerase [Candidatus Omnitrophica bacterium]|nr:KpsF/GutQ family sugar-phosphate isomerase [Candidatus Omnitrophota bacterium]